METTLTNLLPKVEAEHKPDLTILLGVWGSDACATIDADLDADGTVGAGDLVILLGAWGACLESGSQLL